VTHGPHHRVQLKNTWIQKCWLVVNHRMNVSWCTQAILKRNKHWNIAPAGTAFSHHRTKLLHSIKKLRFVKRIRHLKWAVMKKSNKLIIIEQTHKQTLKCFENIDQLMLMDSYIVCEVRGSTMLLKITKMWNEIYSLKHWKHNKPANFHIISYGFFFEVISISKQYRPFFQIHQVKKYRCYIVKFSENKLSSASR